MNIRRFVGKNESLSHNLVGSPVTMHVAHSSTFTSKPSQDQRAHDSYRAMCERLGIPVLTHEAWLKLADKPASASLSRNQQSFHNGSYDPTSSTGLYEPPRREWSGTWDNAVRSLES